DTLNELLERMATSPDCSLERVLGYFRDTAEHASRSELIELLCVERVSCLSVRAKVALLHTLMVMRLSSCSGAEVGVQRLLLSAEGDDLSDLKSMQDGSGDIHSMHKLIWQDVVHDETRSLVLNHFLSEGTAQVAHRALLGSNHFRTLIQQGLVRNCIPEHLSFLQDSFANRLPGGARSGPSYDGQCGHS
ncbi:unnamed protein product, partial [Polarella glacialis]